MTGRGRCCYPLKKVVLIHLLNVDNQLYNLSGKNQGTMLYKDDILANPRCGVVDHDGEDGEFGLLEIKVVLPEDVWSAYGGKVRGPDETLEARLKFLKNGWTSGQFRNPVAEPRIALVVATIQDENTKKTVTAIVDKWKNSAKEAVYTIIGNNELDLSEEMKRLVMKELRGEIMNDIRRYHTDKLQEGNKEVVKYLNAIYGFMK